MYKCVDENVHKYVIPFENIVGTDELLRKLHPLELEIFHPLLFNSWQHVYIGKLKTENDILIFFTISL